MERGVGWVVGIGAALLLAGSYAWQAGTAVAESSGDAIAQINAIAAEAGAAIDSAVAAADHDLGEATSVGEARAIRDAARDAVAEQFQTAEDDIEAIAVDNAQQGGVENAAANAIDGLDAHADAADDRIKQLYDEWKFQQDAPPAAEVIASLNQQLADGLSKIDDAVVGFAGDLEGATDSGQAADERVGALHRIEQRVEITYRALDRELAKRAFDQEVVAAHSHAVSSLETAGAAASDAVDELYAAWVPASSLPPVTTTTTTAGQTTTTTTRATTGQTAATSPPGAAAGPVTAPGSTELAERGPVVRLPATDPGRRDPAVLDATASDATSMPTEMPTVGLVRRIVDTQLPTGIAAVAAGPLVVVGLVLDAVRAAGTLMLLPWALLGLYMVGLLRGARAGEI